MNDVEKSIYKDNAKLAIFYNAIYTSLNESMVFQDILQEVFSNDYQPGLGNFSFIRRSDLVLLKRALPFTNDKSILLELGCGTGGLIRHLVKKRSGTIVGIDISPYAISEASRLTEKKYGETCFAVADMSELPFPSNSIDGIFSIDAIHHASPYIAIASEIVRVLKFGGTLTFFHWTGREACLKSPRLDPLYRALLENGLKIDNFFEVDPGLFMQLKVYAAIYDSRERVVNELGNEVYGLLMNEARLMWSHAGKVSRIMAIFSKIDLSSS